MFQEPGRRRDGGMIRITSGCESVRLRIIHKINAEHRQPGAVGQFGHDMNELRRRALVDLLGAVHREHQLVGIPVGEEIHRRSDEERGQGAARSTEQIADRHEQSPSAQQAELPCASSSSQSPTPSVSRAPKIDVGISQ
jgi:hypothetical protein